MSLSNFLAFIILPPLFHCSDGGRYIFLYIKLAALNRVDLHSHPNIDIILKLAYISNPCINPDRIDHTIAQLKKQLSGRGLSI
jgi:hypothetical protein